MYLVTMFYNKGMGIRYKSTEVSRKGTTYRLSTIMN